MRMNYCIFARYAELSSSDDTYSLFGGGFKVVLTDKLPVTLPTFAVVASVLADHEELGDFRISTIFVDPSGEPLEAAVADLPIRFDENARESKLVFNFFGLKIDKAGIHQFKIGIVGGPQLGAASFDVEVSEHS